MSDIPFREYALIFGGVGFIGTNLAERLLRDGRRVVLFDDFSRRGVEQNARYLAELAPGRVVILREDVRNAARVTEAVRGASEVYHFAAQVAVTTSLVDPERDFEVNIRGTFNVLEAIRKSERRPPLLFTSTNKVYGDLAGVELKKLGTRYEPADPVLARSGIDETTPLDFHSPYGCSKGAADQYVLDYSRSFGLRSSVFRMSCIYGPHQCGNEDQGWVAHFLIRALARQPITIYGDGLQVRDILYVGDLVEAFLVARDNIDVLAGQAFNVGGGPQNCISLVELIQQIGALVGSRPDVRFAATRTGDQRYFVTDTSRLRRAAGWAPTTGVEAGLAKLHAWLVRANALPAKERELASEALRGPALRPRAVGVP